MANTGVSIGRVGRPITAAICRRAYVICCFVSLQCPFLVPHTHSCLVILCNDLFTLAVKDLLKKRPFAARGACVMEVPMRDRSLRRVRVRGIGVDFDDRNVLSRGEDCEGEGESATSAADQDNDTDALRRGMI